MSDAATALSPQPSAQPTPSAPASDAQPSATPAAEPQGTPQPGVEAIGGNGGPDWRAMMAGEDAKAIEALSRFKEPGDFLKSYNEQRAALSKRAEPVRLGDNATPEQVAEYRKGLGLPEIAKDAKPEAYQDAYKIKAPEGYQMSEVEKGVLSDYAKLAYEQGHSPREVKAATDFFFRQQAAGQQAQNRVAVDYMKASQNTLRDELGSAEYEAQQAAGELWLKNEFKDNPDEFTNLLHAQMPNGGKLGDNPWFFKLIAKQAMGAGYTDRIEANTLEAGGKSLAQQQQEIENMRFKDKAGYDAAMKPGGLYEKIIGARQARGEIDEFGNEARPRRSA